MANLEQASQIAKGIIIRRPSLDEVRRITINQTKHGREIIGIWDNKDNGRISVKATITPVENREDINDLTESLVGVDQLIINRKT